MLSAKAKFRRSSTIRTAWKLGRYGTIGWLGLMAQRFMNQNSRCAVVLLVPMPAR